MGHSQVIFKEREATSRTLLAIYFRTDSTIAVGDAKKCLSRWYVNNWVNLYPELDTFLIASEFAAYVIRLGNYRGDTYIVPEDHFPVEYTYVVYDSVKPKDAKVIVKNTDGAILWQGNIHDLIDAEYALPEE